MPDHPLGDINGTSGSEASSPVAEPSIVDQILNLDDFLSGDVRRAEKTARFCTRPDLEADVDDLHAELAAMGVDDRGRLPDQDDESLGDGGRTAQTVALELRAKQVEMGKYFRSVRVRALPEEEWRAFYEKHRKDLEDNKRTPAMWDELIIACAIAPTFTPETIRAFRKKASHTAVDEIATAAWLVNTQSGVSIPKSSLSSAVLKRMPQG